MAKKAFKRLERVLQLEAQQDYQNKAVVGGIRQFAAFWVGQAREEATSETDQALIEQVAEVLTGYGNLSGQEARAKALNGLLNKLKLRPGASQSATPSTTKRKKARHSEPKKQRPQRKERQPRQQQPRQRQHQHQEQRPPKHKPTPPIRTVLPKAEPDPEGLAQPVNALKGIGPKISEKLNKVGASSIHELLYIFPRRYDDYTVMKPINKLEYGEQVTIIGTIWQTRARRTRNKQVMVQSTINDGTGSIQATWYNQSWLADKLQAGMQIVLSGKVDQFLGRPVFNSPEWEALELEPLRTRRIVPVYPLTDGLNSNKMRNIMKTAVPHWAARLSDPLPETIRKRQKLTGLPRAVHQVHFPDNKDSLHHARKRIIFDELFLLQLGMQGLRKDLQTQPGIPVKTDVKKLAAFFNALSFKLTGAQQRVVEELLQNMSQPTPMNRLLQGDVGSGKTVVAAAAMVAAVAVGCQAALMAPTGILAEQHYSGLEKLLSPLGITVTLLTGNTPAKQREEILAGLADGSIQIAIGTHALIQEKVGFNRLALAIVDEQHRFGVDQRAALRDKGPMINDVQANPHVLVMSATPIPRSLALSLYGDLDLSIIDEMPPGRQEIKTRWLQASERERAYRFVRRQVQAGRQAYIIYPLVEESEKIDAKAAVQEFEHLQKEIFPNLKLGLVHGRLKASEKEAAMRAFYKGETNILIATSVIEVGVDVPNSTVMLIEGANRFGLAQLHQFRGRVGRGEHQSYCILLASHGSSIAEERLTALEKTNDGFILAEKDLEIRGPGEFFGRRQSGIPELQMASLMDMEMLEIAQKEAATLIEADPELKAEEHQLLRERVARFWEKAGDVS